MSVSSTPIIPPLNPSRERTRLRLKPAGSISGYVDGAWWPRSRDLAAELPALAEVLSVRLGVVWRVVYALTSWEPAPRRIRLDGRDVRLEGFRSQDGNVISVIASDRRRIRLLVIPQDMTEVASHDAMMAAAGRDNSDSPTMILALDNRHPGEPSA
ncbi:DUF5994 family protein [Kibdelosporangium aridum]|uniref:Uncharacterized protein n=1 Tax=Kibdelosporangium aridum TaxID=2030 RepID=A0A1W2FLW5_KIBAR|nr:DUF5994 family protein [Kibdelosporangium aridum]SMD22764.1 hypothetical protein SAMN05661093_07584 [Kibdelosporangium aridum]